MSISVSLQNFIIARLQANLDVVALISDRVWDSPPSNPEFPYISFGASDIVRDDADCIRAREETIQMDIWVRKNGRKWPCKQLVDAVVDALLDADGHLATGNPVSLNIGIVRILDDPDGITAHGVVQVTAIIEEAFHNG